MIYSVPIIIDEGVSPVFVKANRKVLNIFEVTNNSELVDCWKKHFDADLDLENKLIKFNTQQSKMHFVLNFS